MTAGALAARLSLLLAAAGALRLWRRAPSHAAVTLWLCLAVAVDCARPLLSPGLAARAAYLAMPALSAGLAWAGALDRARWRAAAGSATAWVALAVWLAAATPTSTDYLQACRAAFGVALVAQALAAGWVLAPGNAVGPGGQVALLLLAADLAAALAGPWAASDARAAWDLGRWQYAIAYCTVALVQERRARWIRALSCVERSEPGSWPSAPPSACSRSPSWPGPPPS